MRKLSFIALGYILAAAMAFVMCYNWYRIGYKHGYIDCIEEYQADIDTLRALHGELVRLYDEVKMSNKN